MSLSGFATSLVLGLGLSSSLSIPGNLGATNNLVAWSWFWETPVAEKAFCFAVPDRPGTDHTDYIYRTIYGADRNTAQKKVGSGADFYHSGSCQYEGKSYSDSSEPYSPNDN